MRAGTCRESHPFCETAWSQGDSAGDVTRFQACIEKEGRTNCPGWSPLDSWFYPLWLPWTRPHITPLQVPRLLRQCGFRAPLPGVSTGHPASRLAAGGSEDLLTLRAFGASPAACCGSWPPRRCAASPLGRPGRDAGSNRQKRWREPAVPPGRVIRPGGRQLGVSPNPRPLFHSAFNFI